MMLRNPYTLLALAVFSAACGDSPTQNPQFDHLVIESARRLIATGDSMSLGALGIEANGDSVGIDDASITWSSSSPSILSVSDDGVLSAKAAGVAKISAAAMGAYGWSEFRVLERVPSFISYQSEPGDFIGQGLARTHQLPPGSWQAYTQPAAGGGIWNVYVLTHRDDGLWLANFTAPLKQALEERTYTDATRFPRQGSYEPGLDFSAHGRGCSSLHGSFTVDRLVLENDSTIALLHARFTQRCRGASAALHGELRIFGL